MKGWRRPAVLFVVIVAFVSCRHIRTVKPLRFDKQEDAGSVHIAVQSVAPFEGYINSLQPQFALKTEDAITAAIQQTQTEDSQLFSAVLASLNLGLPQNTSSKTTTVKDGTSTTTGTETEASGDLSKVTPAAAPPNNSLGTLTLPSTSVGLDQSLKFRAAAALLQEVSLLNNYVRNAAIRRGARPYVVRLLVTLLPNAHREPYDAYSTISFFEAPGGEMLQTSAVESYLNPEKPACERQKEEEATNKEDPDVTEAKNAIAAGNRRPCNGPVDVIPLLVTDNIESSLHSDSVQRIRDMAGALQGFLGNSGVGASSRRRSEESSKSLNQNLNSIFTLALVSSNSVEARLGAVYANSHFVMVPRTYNVTVLLLVPTATNSGIGTEIVPCSSIRFTSLTHMRDAERGTLLPSRMAEALEPQFRLLASNWNLEFSPKSLPHYYELVNHAASGDFESFEKGLRKIPAARGDTSWASVSGGAASIWNDFVSLAAMTGRSSGTVEIPLNEPAFFDRTAYGTLIDNGKSTELVLKGATNLMADRISGLLKFVCDEKPVFLNNIDVAVSLDGRSATLTFPSLRKLAKDGDPGKVFISVRHERGSREWQTSSYTRVWYPMRPATDQDCDDGFIHEIGERFCEQPITYIFVPTEAPAPVR